MSDRRIWIAEGQMVNGKKWFPLAGQPVCWKRDDAAMYAALWAERLGIRTRVQAYVPARTTP